MSNRKPPHDPPSNSHYPQDRPPVRYPQYPPPPSAPPGSGHRRYSHGQQGNVPIETSPRQRSGGPVTDSQMGYQEQEPSAPRGQAFSYGQGQADNGRRAQQSFGQSSQPVNQRGHPGIAPHISPSPHIPILSLHPITPPHAHSWQSNSVPKAPSHSYSAPTRRDMSIPQYIPHPNQSGCGPEESPDQPTSADTITPQRYQEQTRGYPHYTEQHSSGASQGMRRGNWQQDVQKEMDYPRNQISQPGPSMVPSSRNNSSSTPTYPLVTSTGTQPRPVLNRREDDRTFASFGGVVDHRTVNDLTPMSAFPSNAMRHSSSRQSEQADCAIPTTRVLSTSAPQASQPHGAMTSTREFAREPTQMVGTYDQDERWTAPGGIPPDFTDRVIKNGQFPAATGGYADIYEGTLDTPSGPIKVAIKVIKVYSSEWENHAKKTRRLKREIGVWARLSHPNILRLLGTASGFGPYYPAMVCPWLDNGTLTTYLRRVGTDLEISEMLLLICDVASGLQYLHSNNIVHGDLSGNNVLIDADGNAYIADFGLSIVLDPTFILSSTGKLRATVRWAAPELFDVHHDAIAHLGPMMESDIYSFGAIMLQILTGKVPYPYYSRDEQVVAAISRGVPHARPDDPRVNEDRWSFIQRCWTHFGSIDQRPTCDELVVFARGDYDQHAPSSGVDGLVYGMQHLTTF